MKLVHFAFAAILFISTVILFSGAKTEALVLCYYTGESSSGANKVCYYDCGGSQAAVTVSSTRPCPSSINR